jgi:hypothetical protein
MAGPGIADEAAKEKESGEKSPEIKNLRREHMIETNKKRWISWKICATA